MAGDLMTSAVCWELGHRVPPGFARLNPQMSYFCLWPDCVIPVHGKCKKNEFFCGTGVLHDDRCPHHKTRRDRNAVPQAPQRHPLARLPALVPNWLGAVPPALYHGVPTVDERRAMAQNLADTPPLVPGSLSDVVAAFRNMDPQTRRSTQLTVEGVKGNYGSAFKNVGIGDPVSVDEIVTPTPIFYCGGIANFDDGIWWVCSRKRFGAGDQLLPLRFRVREKSPQADFLAGLIKIKTDQQVELFWHRMDAPRQTEHSLMGELFETTQTGTLILTARSPK